MLARLRHLAARLRSSLWFVPAWMCVAAAALAYACGLADDVLQATEGAEPLQYVRDREGARVLLSTVAGSMITVAGVAFSITVVALSLASSQLGPRLLVNFMRDRGNQLVLGTFIATYLFCLVALARGTQRVDTVPTVSVTVGLGLAIASLAVLIYFFHHIASSIRAEKVVEVVSRDLERAIDRHFPSEPEEGRALDDDDEPPSFEDATEVLAEGDGYVQRMDADRLVAIAAEHALVLAARRRPGQFVVAGDTLLLARGTADIADELAGRLRGCFILGRHRTPEADVEHGVHQLVEVAVRALSPGINDPYTAISCVNWLSAMLAKVADRPVPSPLHRDRDGELRLVEDAVTFEGMLAGALSPIRQSARTMPPVSLRLLEALAAIAARVERDAHRAAVREQADMVLASALTEPLQGPDRQGLLVRHRAVADAFGDG